MHPVKALALVCVGMASLCYALPATVSISQRESELTAPEVQARQENSEQQASPNDEINGHRNFGIGLRA